MTTYSQIRNATPARTDARSVPRKKINVQKWAVYLFMVLASLASVVPFIWMLITSLKTQPIGNTSKHRSTSLRATSLSVNS